MNKEDNSKKKSIFSKSSEMPETSSTATNKKNDTDVKNLSPSSANTNIGSQLKKVDLKRNAIVGRQKKESKINNSPRAKNSKDSDNEFHTDISNSSTDLINEHNAISNILKEEMQKTKIDFSPELKNVQKFNYFKDELVIEKNTDNSKRKSDFQIFQNDILEHLNEPNKTIKISEFIPKVTARTSGASKNLKTVKAKQSTQTPVKKNLTASGITIDNKQRAPIKKPSNVIRSKLYADKSNKNIKPDLTKEVENSKTTSQASTFSKKNSNITAHVKEKTDNDESLFRNIDNKRISKIFENTNSASVSNKKLNDIRPKNLSQVLESSQDKDMRDENKTDKRNYWSVFQKNAAIVRQTEISNNKFKKSTNKITPNVSLPKGTVVRNSNSYKLETLDSSRSTTSKEPKKNVPLSTPEPMNKNVSLSRSSNRNVKGASEQNTAKSKVSVSEKLPYSFSTLKSPKPIEKKSTEISKKSKTNQFIEKQETKSSSQKSSSAKSTNLKSEVVGNKKTLSMFKATNSASNKKNSMSPKTHSNFENSKLNAITNEESSPILKTLNAIRSSKNKETFSESDSTQYSSDNDSLSYNVDFKVQHKEKNKTAFKEAPKPTQLLSPRKKLEFMTQKKLNMDSYKSSVQQEPTSPTKKKISSMLPKSFSQLKNSNAKATRNCKFSSKLESFSSDSSTQDLTSDSEASPRLITLYEKAQSSKHTDHGEHSFSLPLKSSGSQKSSEALSKFKSSKLITADKEKQELSSDFEKSPRPITLSDKSLLSYRAGFKAQNNNNDILSSPKKTAVYTKPPHSGSTFKSRALEKTITDQTTATLKSITDQNIKNLDVTFASDSDASSQSITNISVPSKFTDIRLQSGSTRVPVSPLKPPITGSARKSATTKTLNSNRSIEDEELTSDSTASSISMSLSDISKLAKFSDFKPQNMLKKETTLALQSPATTKPTSSIYTSHKANTKTSKISESKVPIKNLATSTVRSLKTRTTVRGETATKPESTKSVPVTKTKVQHITKDLNASNLKTKDTNKLNIVTQDPNYLKLIDRTDNSGITSKGNRKTLDNNEFENQTAELKIERDEESSDSDDRTSMQKSYSAESDDSLDKSLIQNTVQRKKKLKTVLERSSYEHVGERDQLVSTDTEEYEKYKQQVTKASVLPTSAQRKNIPGKKNNFGNRNDELFSKAVLAKRAEMLLSNSSDSIGASAETFRIKRKSDALNSVVSRAAHAEIKPKAVANQFLDKSKTKIDALNTLKKENTLKLRGISNKRDDLVKNIGAIKKETDIGTKKSRFGTNSTLPTQIHSTKFNSKPNTSVTAKKVTSNNTIAVLKPKPAPSLKNLSTKKSESKSASTQKITKNLSQKGIPTTADKRKVGTMVLKPKHNTSAATIELNKKKDDKVLTSTAGADASRDQISHNLEHKIDQLFPNVSSYLGYTTKKLTKSAIQQDSSEQQPVSVIKNLKSKYDLSKKIEKEKLNSVRSKPIAPHPSLANIVSPGRGRNLIAHSLRPLMQQPKNKCGLEITLQEKRETTAKGEKHRIDMCKERKYFKRDSNKVMDKGTSQEGVRNISTLKRNITKTTGL